MDKIVKNYLENIENLNSGDFHNLKNQIDRLYEYKRALMQYSKYRKGQNVVVENVRNISATNAWGWLGYKEQLENNPIGKIMDIDYYNGSFQYDIMFRFEPCKIFTISEKEI